MPYDLSPLWLSLRVAVISTLFVFLASLALARLMSRREFFGKSLVEALILLPLVLPPTVIGFGLIVLFGANLGFCLNNGLDFVWSLPGSGQRSLHSSCHCR